MQVRVPIVIVAGLVLGAASTPRAAAVVLDWNVQTWTPVATNNTLRQDFDVDGTAGTDIRLTLAYSTQNAGSPWRSGLPAVDTTLEGGQQAGTKSLHLGVDFTAQAHTITVTIEFPNYGLGVEGISFSLFDIDRADGSAAYIDQIRSISGTAPDGTLVQPVISGTGSTVSHSGTDFAQTLTGTGPAADSGAGSSAGNATISFASPIRSFTFVWGVPTSNANNPVPMDISFGNINFSPVPDVNPTFAAALVCGGAGWVFLRRRKAKA